MLADSCPNGRTVTGASGYRVECGQPAPGGAKPLMSDRTQKKKLRSETMLIKISKIPIMACMLLIGGLNSTPIPKRTCGKPSGSIACVRK